MAAPAKPAAKKGGKKKGKWTMYSKAGDKLERKNKTCPKCGPGCYMAKHASRTTCGNCHYTEFSSK